MVTADWRQSREREKVCELRLLTGSLPAPPPPALPGVKDRRQPDPLPWSPPLGSQVRVETDSLSVRTALLPGGLLHTRAHTRSHYCQSTPLKCTATHVGTGNGLWVDVLKITHYLM